MALITYFTDRSAPASGLSSTKHIAKQRIDFSKKNVSSADVVELMELPAGAFVSELYANVITAEGATCTGTVGDGVDPNGYIASLDLNATGITTITGTHSGAVTAGTPAFEHVKYAAADTIDITMSNGASTAVFDLIVVYTLIVNDAE